MNYYRWLSILLLGCLCTVYAEDQCDMDEQMDEYVYLFGYGYSWGPYEHLNDDGELMGLGYDMTRSICKIMKKKCEHAVYYDYNYAYDSQGLSIALNDRWYTALVNWVPTPQRLSSYQFSSAIAQEPATYMYARSNSGIDNVNEALRDADNFGFRKGFYTSPECLGNYLGSFLGGKAIMYDDGPALEEALRNKDVDVIFLNEIDLQDKNAVKRIGNEPVKCAAGGISTMYRKDLDLSWYSEGLKKLRENKDYDWLCNMNGNGVNPGCLED